MSSTSRTPEGGTTNGSGWRRAWLIAGLCVLLGALGGFAAFLLRSPVYEATTAVLVLPTSGGQDTSVGGSQDSSQVQIETEAELARSAQVADAASTLTRGVVSPETLLADSTVTVPTNSQVLVVSFRAPTAEEARDGSAALAKAYLDRRAAQAADDAAAVVEALEAQLATLNERLAANATAIATATDAGKEALAQSQRALLLDQIADINTRLVALKVDTGSGGQVITAASLPADPVSPVLWLNVLVGLAVGGLVGALVLLGHESRVERRRRADRNRGGRLSALLSMSMPLASIGAQPDAPALRRLVRQIAAHPGTEGPTTIVGLGDPLQLADLTLQLNQAWAQEIGASVLVVADPAVALTDLVGSPLRGPGLADVLRGEATALESATALPGTHSAVMGPGHESDVPVTSRQYEAMPSVWTQLSDEYGDVLVQTAAPSSALARAVVQSSGRIVVAVRKGSSQSAELMWMRDELESMGLAKQTVGVVVLPGADETVAAAEGAPVSTTSGSRS